MRLLSAIPKLIVIAMNIALAGLVVLSTVPIAVGGMSIDYMDVDISYNKNHNVHVNIKADVSTNLYFDITGLYCEVTFSSGGRTLPAFESESFTIPRSGSTSIDFDAAIPATTIMMAILSGVSLEDSETAVAVTIHASTLSDMISVSAGIDVPLTSDMNGTIVVSGNSIDNFDGFTAGFTATGSETITKIFGTDRLDISIGGVTGFIHFIQSGSDCVVNAGMVSEGPSLTAAIDGTRDPYGRVKATMTTNGEDIILDLTKEQVDFVIEALKIIFEVWDPWH